MVPTEIDVTHRIEADAAENVSGRVAEMLRHVAVRRLVQRDAEDDRQRVDRDRLDELDEIHRCDRYRAIDFIRLDRPFRARALQPLSAATGPLPSRTISATGPVRSTTVVGSMPHDPPSSTRSTSCSSRRADLVRVGQRPLVAGQRERRRQQRLAELGEQRAARPDDRAPAARSSCAAGGAGAAAARASPPG